MSPTSRIRRTIAFINLAHALDHFVLLVYPTAVLAIAIERGIDYSTLIALASGTFVAFGLFSLPVGWIAARVGERAMMTAFFAGCGIAMLGTATATTFWEFAGWLLLLGIFSAIYHPVGASMLVATTTRLGPALGLNGVCGNLGAASASGITAAIAATLGWRAAFIVPGLVCLAAAIGFLMLVPTPDPAHRAAVKSAKATVPVARPLLLLAVFAVAIVAGGMTFNVTTIALPKVIDERLGMQLPLALTGSLATLVFLLGALMQLAMGRIVERFTLPVIFVSLAVLQPLGLFLAAQYGGIVLLAGLALTMSALYGQVVVNDAMVARYVPGHFRAKAYSIRYFLGFTASGFAVPMIAFLHDRGGFPVVLGVTALFGLAIVLSAFVFMILMRPIEASVPAE